MEQLHQKIALLNQATLESLSERDEKKIVEKFTQVGIKLTNADFGLVWLTPENGSGLELVYKSPSTPFNPLPPREIGINSKLMGNNNPVLIEDYEKDSHFRPFTQGFVKSLIAIPIFFKATTYGSIYLCFSNKQNFSPELQSLAVFIGNSAAQAITINRLLQSEHQARQETENQQARFRALIENSHDVIALFSPQGEILYISPSATRISGYEMDYLMGRNLKDFIHEQDMALVNSHMQETLQNPQSSKSAEFRYYHKDGSVRWLESIGLNMLENPSVGSIVANLRDITERKIAQETILHQALHDSLTNLPNRKEFAIRMDRALEGAKRHKRMLALMFLDIDRFKSINDTLGHATGDTLLKIVATRFNSCIRSDDTVARFGGDEFLILLNEINSSQDAAIVAEKVLKATAIPVQIGPNTFHPSVSIGIAVYPHDGEDRENLKKHADIALYRAKENGRNCYCLYDNSMDIYVAEKFALENELREAISSGQIVLYYQPIINLKNNKLLAVEALARWQHPTRGLLLPGEFIPLAEETGLIWPLSEYILKKACRDYKAWQEMELGKFRVAVNFSAHTFTENSFISQLGAILEEYNMQPEDLEVEITESVAMGNLELTNLNLKQLKKMGVYITIDDFGTGYSSLSYLKSFPIRNLKIDRSFVRHSITNEQDASITRTIISMAHNLNLKVTAEGVETEQQLNFLASLGCDAVQGYFIHTPMPPQELPAWINGQKDDKTEALKKSFAAI